MNTLAVILARGGSVGLASKHLRLLLGRPVIEYTFDHAFDAALLQHVVVSTDCPGIAGLARRSRLAVVDRPADLATSDASVQEVMLHALKHVEQTTPFRADALVVLYGNVPVRGTGVIDRAVELLRETGCDSVRSFCPVGKWHPAWMSELVGRPCGAVAARQHPPPPRLSAAVAARRSGGRRLPLGDAPRAALPARPARLLRHRPPRNRHGDGRDRRDRPRTRLVLGRSGAPRPPASSLRSAA